MDHDGELSPRVGELQMPVMLRGNGAIPATGNTLKGNFGFLEPLDARLAEFATQAERFCLEDPCACLFKLRLFVERLAKLSAQMVFPHWAFREDLFKLLQRLEEHGAFGAEVGRSFHRIRKLANTAVHYGLASEDEAMGALRLAHGLAVWYAHAQGQPGGNGGRGVPAFVEPGRKQAGALHRISELERQAADLTRMRDLAEARAQMAQLRLKQVGTLAEELGADELARLVGHEPALPKGSAEMAASFARRCREAEELMAHRELPLAEARWVVAEELREAGWDVPGEGAGLYEVGARPQAGANLVLNAWPTYAGPADFVMFCGLTPMAMLALRPDLREPAAALALATKWSHGYVFQPGEVPAPGAPWGMARVPWVLATNGHPPAAGGLAARDLRKLGASTHVFAHWPQPTELLG